MRGMTEHLAIGDRIAFHRRRRGQSQEVLAGLVGRTEDWHSCRCTGRCSSPARSPRPAPRTGRPPPRS
ncbi:MAG: hypothetical protein GEU83_00015 [Pseudonocardiaceae bacterium]|nr:hypothetical protein [Pseudonocardiaceae bacterium]